MKQKKLPTNEELIDGYDYLANAASATDCTGLMPTPASTPEERESYEDVYYYRPDLQAIMRAQAPTTYEDKDEH